MANLQQSQPTTTFGHARKASSERGTHSCGCAREGCPLLTMHDVAGHDTHVTAKPAEGMALFRRAPGMRMALVVARTVLPAAAVTGIGQ